MLRCLVNRTLAREWGEGCVRENQGIENEGGSSPLRVFKRPCLSAFVFIIKLILKISSPTENCKNIINCHRPVTLGHPFSHFATFALVLSCCTYVHLT